MRTLIAALVISLYLPVSADAQLRIATNADSLDIPMSKVGFSREGTIRLSNISDSTVHINSMTIVPFFAVQYEFIIYVPAATSFSLDSGAFINIVIQFTPQTAGFHSAGLLIETDEGTKEITLRGTGVTLQPDIVMSPDTIDFGTLAPGDQKDTTFLLFSGGKDKATIDYFEIANDFGAPVFDVTADGPGNLFPLDVIGKDTSKFTVQFSAFGPNGDRTGRVIMEGLATGITVCEFRGKVGWPDLSFNPQVIDLGELPQGSSADTFVYLVSTGESPVKITKIDSPSVPFTISGIPIFPHAIIPGDSIKIEIHFDASAPGDFNAQIVATAKPVSVYLLNSAVFLKASVTPHVLSLKKPQPFNISCAIDSVYEQSLTISDTGQYPVFISSISCSDPRFIIHNVSFPDTIIPGVSGNISVGFTATSGTTDTNCVLTFFSNGRVALTDTIYVTVVADHAQLTLAPIVSDASVPYSNQVGISASNDLSRFALHSLAMDMTIAPSDVAEIDTLNVHIDNSVFPNAVVQVSYNSATRIYHAVLNSTTTLSATSAKAFMQIPLHYFVAKDTLAVLHISVLSPEREGCLSFSDDSIPVAVSGSCGDPEIRNLLNNVPLISGMRISPNPSGSNRATILFFNSENIWLSLFITDINGRLVNYSNSDSFATGNNAIPLDIPSLASGVYQVRLSAFSPHGRSQNIFSTLIIAR